VAAGAPSKASRQAIFADGVNDLPNWVNCFRLHDKAFLMRMTIIAIIILVLENPGCAQNAVKTNTASTKHVGGNCEGCEAIFESPVTFTQLKSVDTLPDFSEPGPKMEISGIVYQRDGKTPAKDVVLYVYHTDQTGHYTPGPNAKGWEKRNGRIRGWIKTDQRGFYKFYTLRPGHYPNTNIPAHVHIVIKEPDKNEYYIDEYLFQGDSFLSPSEISRQEKRGGSGIISLENKGGMLHGKRNIILGLNIPNY
jgi:protocatechuate 3,4-dioxygenase beta subunit